MILGDQRFPGARMSHVHDWLVRSRLSERGGRHKSPTASDLPALSLLHFADKYSARAGETVSFTALIHNSSQRPVAAVELVPRSLTNANAEQLTFDSQPGPGRTTIPCLGSGESVSLDFSYIVRQSDVLHGGGIVSVMEIRFATDCGWAWDKCEAVVNMRGSHRGSWLQGLERIASSDV
jgi:hypothetical protein